jgi:hypothetical protein
MTKKTVINFNAQTPSQMTFIVDPHQDGMSTVEELFTKEKFITAQDKVILTEQMKEKSTKENSETAG